MNSILAQFFRRTPQPGRRRGGAFILSLIVTLLAAVPAEADPVRINQVVQTLTPHGFSNVKLDTLVSQGLAGSPAQQNGSGNEKQVAQELFGSDSLLSGVSVISDPQKVGVEIIEEGEVEGSICDCGEILIAGGAFPKWPLVFLSAVPFIFINDCETCNPTRTPTPPSIPTPTPVPTPEPASLLLIGTGLLATGISLRRRYAKTKAMKGPEEE